MENDARRKFTHHMHALIVLALAVLLLYFTFRDRGISEADFAPADPVIAEPLFRAK